MSFAAERKLAEALASDKMLQARKLMVDLALSLTKLKPRMRVAIRLVIVTDMKVAKAAHAVRRDRQHVYRALKVFKPHYEAVKAEVAKHGQTV